MHRNKYVIYLIVFLAAFILSFENTRPLARSGKFESGFLSNNINSYQLNLFAKAEASHECETRRDGDNYSVHCKGHDSGSGSASMVGVLVLAAGVLGKAHPLGWVVSAVGGVSYLIYRKVGEVSSSNESAEGILGENSEFSCAELESHLENSESKIEKLEDNQFDELVNSQDLKILPFNFSEENCAAVFLDRLNIETN